MNKRLGTLIAALSLAAVAQAHGATGPTPQPTPVPKPAPCTLSKQPCVPAPLPCGGPGNQPCQQPPKAGTSFGIVR
jgi:hypothetical protein